MSDDLEYDPSLKEETERIGLLYDHESQSMVPLSKKINGFAEQSRTELSSVATTRILEETSEGPPRD